VPESGSERYAEGKGDYRDAFFGHGEMSALGQNRSFDPGRPNVRFAARSGHST
jgi:hypothetical protein